MNALELLAEVQLGEDSTRQFKVDIRNAESLAAEEELRRLFQLTGQFHADELPTKAGVDKLDKLRFRDFLRDTYDIDYPETTETLTQLSNYRTKSLVPIKDPATFLAHTS